RAAPPGEVGPGGVDVVLAADDVDATPAPRLWPEGIADGARDWVTENITAGRIARLDLRVDLDAAALEGGLPPTDAVYGEARIEDAEIHYLRPMPPATGADATARFDGDRMTFTITGGAAAGVEVTGGEVVVRDYADPSTVERLEVDLAGRGSVPAILALTDHEPLTLASRKGLPVADSAGSGTFELEVGLPLLRDLELDAVDLAFAGTFADVALPNMAAGRDLSDVDLTMEATVDTVSAAGRGRVGGIPLDLTFEVEGDREVLGARGEVDAARLAELGAPPLPLAGTVGLDATITTTGAVERSELSLDVTAAEVDLPNLAVWKPEGVEGTVEVRVVQRGDRLEVERLALSWPGAEIAGAAALDASGRLEALSLDPLRVAGTDLRVTGAREAGTLALEVAGARLDLAPFTGGGDGDVATGRLGAQAPLTLALAIDEVVAGGDGALTGLDGRLHADGDGLSGWRLAAGIRPGDGVVRTRLEPANDGARLTLTTDDAGGVAAALGLSGELRGGLLEFTGDVTARRPHWRIAGEIAAQDFVLRGTPPVMRVLAAAPATEDLADDDLAVASFNSPITLDGRVVTLEDALLIASNLAVRTSGDVDLDAERLELEGSLAPVQGVNRFIGSLPLIGALLQGSQKAGAVALSFTVDGPWRDPAVSVNPLSVVTPGVLQDLFAGAEVRPPRVPKDTGD
ncbi:MAG: AsmA-like C-terminal domain-containing protein, partial [Alphaproteobacteria bacterium]